MSSLPSGVSPVPAADAEPFLLARATELRGLPVVGLTSGEALADIRDVIYNPDEGRIEGFTLNKHGGLLAGPLKQQLPIEAVHAVGRDAVMVPADDAIGATPAGGGAAGADRSRNVLGDQVLTDAGDRLGVVDDLVVAVGVLGRAGGPGAEGPAGGESGAGGGVAGGAGRQRQVGDVVGYEVVADAALQGKEGARVLVPLPNTLAVSGETLMVPAAVRPFIRDDLAGFGAAVEEFRAGLDRGRGE